MTERELLLNAFRPGTAIALPSQFAGRKDEIDVLTDSLHTDGACPCIVGERGLGKSSLALQVVRIALGDVELLTELGLADMAISPDRAFTAFYFTCSDATSSKDEILQRLINTAEGLITSESVTGPPLRSKTVKTAFKLKVFEREVAKTYDETAAVGRFKRLSVEERFELIVNRTVEERGTRVLIIIDELDRVRDTKGLASVIKNMSSADIRFLLVGIGQNVSDLLHDHVSLQRSLVQVLTYPMRDDDSAAIITKAMAYLHQPMHYIQSKLLIVTVSIT